MDMLVALYRLEHHRYESEKRTAKSITIRRPMAYERQSVVEWVRDVFGDGWAGECEVAMSTVPATCHIASDDGEVVGFACYDATARGFFGPTGIAPSHRGQGIGAGLLLTSLDAMWRAGYGYAIIGGTNPTLQPFYERVAGAVVIENSDPGVYQDRLRPD